MFLLPYLPINDWLMTNHHNFPPNYWFRSIFFLISRRCRPLSQSITSSQPMRWLWKSGNIKVKQVLIDPIRGCDWFVKFWLITAAPIGQLQSIIKCWIRRWLFGDRALLIMLPVGKSGRGWAEDYRWGDMIRSILKGSSSNIHFIMI